MAFDASSHAVVTSAAPDASGLAGLLPELEWRGLLQAASPQLAARLATGQLIAGYNGFDPTGPSLHVGHLIPVFGLMHLQRHGGRPVPLVGGGTGMVGDPSGKSAERNLLTIEQVRANGESIREQLAAFLDFTPGPTAAVMRNNYDWLSQIGVLDFLRDVGKHFTIPYMLGKDSVQRRLESGLSYTEFSYMLLQSADFLHLYEHDGVELQMGGADQWGNMTAGMELIRRVFARRAEAEADRLRSPIPDEVLDRDEWPAGAAEALAGREAKAKELEAAAAADRDLAHALCYPLLTTSSGAKFGKTEKGAVWLDPNRTSPYDFYQFWVNAEDGDVGKYLRYFTLLDRPTIEALDVETAEHPERRAAQRALAFDITARVHGTDTARRQEQLSAAAFSREPIRDPELLHDLFEALRDSCFVFTTADLQAGALALGVLGGVYASNGEARRAIQQGGLTINDERVTDPSFVPTPIAGEWLVLRAGKRKLAIARLLDSL